MRLIPSSLSDRLLFAVTDWQGEELWLTDGTQWGTFLVKDINPGASSSAPASLTQFQASVFFVADDGSSGRELWRSDGTGPGALFKDLVPGPENSEPEELTPFGSMLVFLP